MVQKEQILKARDEVRLDTLNMLRRDIDNKLYAWLQKEKEGRKTTQVTVNLPFALDGELPEEVRAELEAAGFSCSVSDGILTLK